MWTLKSATPTPRFQKSTSVHGTQETEVGQRISEWVIEVIAILAALERWNLLS